MAELFGFSITRARKQADPKQSFTTTQADDGTQTIAAGGYFGQYLDMEGTAKSEADLIRRYREVALHPECDMAIEDIVNEAIVANELKDAVRVNITDLPYGKDVRRKIENEFKEVLKLLNFNTKGHDIFRRWYVDGRIYYHKIIDRESPVKGITELKYIDPRKIKKIREIRKKRPDGPVPNGLSVVDEYVEYYVFNEKGVSGSTSGAGIKIAPDTIAFCPSGMIDQNKNIVLSYLHKAIKPVNQLRMIEDATVIYRIARAPERRIFKIDVGNLPKVKAEQYLRDVMARYRNKLVYDASTGEIRDDRQYMSMLEDFWLPRREGGRGTEITTLPGGSNLGEVEDIKYFQKKLYKSLNVPVSRLEAEGSFNMGRATEINRDELKFSKFVDRLRTRFNALFHDLLKTQLILKGIVTIEDWENSLARTIRYNYVNDGYYAEIKEAEMFKERMEIYRNLKDSEMIGNIYSKEWAMKNILKMTDIDIDEEQTKIEKEKEAEAPPEGEDDGQF